MRRVRNLLVIGLLLMASACADTGQVKSLPDNPENRATAAKQYLKAMPPKEMLESLATRVAPNLPEKDRKAFMEVMQSADLEKAADRITLEGLVKDFTVGELNAMTAFYGSPEGKSAAKKFGPYMMGVMPQIQQEVKKAMEEKQKLEPKGQPEAGAPPAAKPGAPPAAKPAAPPVAPKGLKEPQAKGQPAPPAPPTAKPAAPPAVMPVAPPVAKPAAPPASLPVAPPTAPQAPKEPPSQK